MFACVFEILHDGCVDFSNGLSIDSIVTSLCMSSSLKRVPSLHLDMIMLVLLALL